MSSIVSIDTRGYDISMGPGFLRVGGGGIAGNVYINGNVGIRTNNPTRALDVSGTLRINSDFTLNSTRLTNSNYIIFSNNTNSYAIQQIDNAGENYFRMGRNGFGDIAISSTGNVGIGTATPTARLDVAGAITASGLITANGGLTAGGSTSISVPNNGASSYYCGTNGSGANIRMFGNGTDAFIDYYGQFNYRSVSSNGGTVLATPFTINSVGLATFNNGLTMGFANNITLGEGTTAPTVGQLGYIYSATITWAGGAGNGLASVEIPAGTYIGIFSVILTGTFVANNYIAVNLGYTARFPIINNVSGTDTAMCSGSFVVRSLTTTTITLSNGIANSQSLSSQNFRIVKIA